MKYLFKSTNFKMYFVTEVKSLSVVIMIILYSPADFSGSQRLNTVTTLRSEFLIMGVADICTQRASEIAFFK